MHVSSMFINNFYFILFYFLFYLFLLVQEKTKMYQLENENAKLKKEIQQSRSQGKITLCIHHIHTYIYILNNDFFSDIDGHIEIHDRNVDNNSDNWVTVKKRGSKKQRGNRNSRENCRRRISSGSSNNGGGYMY